MNRVFRRDLPPLSLSDKISYNSADVQNALAEDFLGKCYLCEGVLNAGFDVDHLKPKSKFPEREFDWNNLFPAHPRCNGRRKKWNKEMWPEGGMLDCAKDDIEERLAQQVMDDDGVDILAVFEPRSIEDLEAKNTAEELNHIHSSTDIAGREILIAVNCRYKKLLHVLLDYYRSRDADGPLHEDSSVILQKLKLMLRVDAPYSGLMRDAFRRLLSDRLKQVVGL
jgi:hypothetical protein